MALGDILDVQQATHNASTNTLALPAFAVNPSNGDTIVVLYSTWTTTGNQAAPTDTGGNTYTQVGTEVANGKPEIIGMWYAHNITGGSSFVVTGHLTSNQYHTCIAWLISGDLVYNSDFTSNGGSTNVSPFSTGTSSPAPSGVALFIGALCIDTSLPTASDGTGWNTVGSHGFTSGMQLRSRYTPFTTIDLYTEYQFTTAAAIAATWGMTGGASHNYNCLVASFGSLTPPQTLSPSPAIATWTEPTPTLTGGAATITAGSAVATWSVPIASVTGSDIAFSPSAAISTWTLGSVSLFLGSGTIAASAAVATWTNPTATLSTGSIIIAANTSVASWTLPTATIIASSVIPPGGGQYTTNRLFTAPAAANSVSITPNAGAWVNSAWVTLVASTDAAWILTGIIVRPDALNAWEMFEVDIGVGAAASEVVVTTFRGAFGSTSFASPGILPATIPLDNIAAGVRVSARLRKSNTTTSAWTVAVQFYKKPLVGVLLTTARPQLTYPPATDDLALTTGASSWANSTYTELTPATASAIVVVGIVISIGSLNSQWEVDLSTGASGSEVVVNTIRAYHTGIQFTDGPHFIPLYRPLDNIPASTRLALRTRASVTSGSLDVLAALVYIEKPL